ncbi:hypothetical protein [Furfurilactobacillus curtus]|uniref:N-acetyltransferase n=1 Tax=Furfurilactobacillus curtus TaxID=1746200 RepID=A0ABQ5JP98_9LACO
MANDVLGEKKFSEINVNDSFFDDLRVRYRGFNEWFLKKSKANEKALTVFDGDKLIAFLYLKTEEGDDDTIDPDISTYKKRLKVGTFKVESHGTVLGNRLISFLLHRFIEGNYDACYVTMYDNLEYLKDLFTRYGFRQYGVRRDTGETVLVRDLAVMETISKNFPRFNLLGTKYLLSILPKFHTALFPESRLNNEGAFKTEDVSETNSIEKTYLTNMREVRNACSGDKLIIYRTANGGSAEYTSVATSVCTVTDNRDISEFTSFEAFKAYVTKQSIFSETELRDFWQNRRYPIILRFQYDVALKHRVNRHDLIEICGLDRNGYPGFMALDNAVFSNVLREGRLNESFIID